MLLQAEILDSHTKLLLGKYMVRPPPFSPLSNLLHSYPPRPPPLTPFSLSSLPPILSLYHLSPLPILSPLCLSQPPSLSSSPPPLHTTSALPRPRSLFSAPPFSSNTLRSASLSLSPLFTLSSRHNVRTYAPRSKPLYLRFCTLDLLPFYQR